MLKIKSFIQSLKRQWNHPNIEPILLGLVVVFVGTGSFMIGRLSVSENSRPEVRICETDETAMLSAKTQVEASGINAGESGVVAVVASKNGTKYHLPTCPGAKQISPANLISFSSIATARASGLTPASNCPGLK